MPNPSRFAAHAISHLGTSPGEAFLARMTGAEWLPALLRLICSVDASGCEAVVTFINSNRDVLDNEHANHSSGSYLMPFAEAFARFLTDAGVPVDSSLVPDRASVDADLDGLASWLLSLEDGTRSAIDKITATHAIQQGLADPSVAIVSSIGAVLAAFDSQPASISVSSALDLMRSAARQAID